MPRQLLPGDPAPWFVIRSTSNERFHFDTVAGRHIVLCFLGSAADAHSRAVHEGFLRRREAFDDENACFFGVSGDPADERETRLRQSLPGFRYFWDFGRQLAKLYGVSTEDGTFNRATFVLDRALRVIAVMPFSAEGPEAHVAQVLQILAAQPRIGSMGAAGATAPILIVPHVFEPELCRTLIDCYRRGVPETSGFMRERDGKTVGVIDDAFKRRYDVIIEDEKLRVACRNRLVDRLKPQVQRAFQFNVTYAERYIVACYDSDQGGGFFRAHRDNTTKGTAHRRFAVTINLNTGEYEGGGLRFPEFGDTAYHAPLGGAIVFSCSLLHEAMHVTRGTRYAFLPFLYDEAAAKLREQNLKFVDNSSPASAPVSPTSTT